MREICKIGDLDDSPTPPSPHRASGHVVNGVTSIAIKPSVNLRTEGFVLRFVRASPRAVHPPKTLTLNVKVSQGYIQRIAARYAGLERQHGGP